MKFILLILTVLGLAMLIKPIRVMILCMFTPVYDDELCPRYVYKGDKLVVEYSYHVYVWYDHRILYSQVYFHKTALEIEEIKRQEKELFVELKKQIKDKSKK